MAKLFRLDSGIFKKMIMGGAAHLKAHANEINDLNVFPVPDGDTGDNMLLTVTSGVSEMNKDSSESVGDAANALSKGMLLGARGNSGVILSQFFSGIAKSLANQVYATASSLAEAFKSGVKQAYRAVASPAEGTILTVARESVEKTADSVDEEHSVDRLISDLTAEMSASLERTPDMLPVLREAGVVDSGGAGLFCIFEGMMNVLTGKGENSVFEIQRTSDDGAGAPDLDAFTSESEMTYGYCTEFLLRLQSSKTNVDEFDESVITDFLKTVGNSIVSFKDGSIVKVHVHTMEPETVLGFCRKFGEFLTVKIENMSVQHNEKLMNDKSKKADEPEKKYGTVVVCSGDGIKETFRELGADCIIDGGQTNNPSTEDFIRAFDEVNSKCIFVFPNNSNIILAAKQAAEMYDRADVHVIESRDLGSGYAGITAVSTEFDSANEIVDACREAAENVMTGQVSPAIRTTDIDGVHIENGDNICFVGKKMVSSRKTKSEAARDLADYMLSSGEKYMLTAFFGEDATKSEQDDLIEYVSKKYPDVEIYPVTGGQAVYSCILVAE